MGSMDFGEVSHFLSIKFSALLDEAANDPTKVPCISGFRKIEKTIHSRTASQKTHPNSSQDSEIRGLLYELISLLSECRVFAQQHRRVVAPKNGFLQFKHFWFAKRTNGRLDELDTKFKQNLNLVGPEPAINNVDHDEDDDDDEEEDFSGGFIGLDSAVGKVVKFMIEGSEKEKDATSTSLLEGSEKKKDASTSLKGTGTEGSEKEKDASASLKEIEGSEKEKDASGSLKEIEGSEKEKDASTSLKGTGTEGSESKKDGGTSLKGAGPEGSEKKKDASPSLKEIEGSEKEKDASVSLKGTGTEEIEGSEKEKDASASLKRTGTEGSGKRKDASCSLKGVAIVGVGGSGKTALAQEVFDSLPVKNMFSPRIWVSLSGTLYDEPVGVDLRVKILRKMLEQAGCDVSELVTTYVGIPKLTEKLYHRLMGKRYLIVFDDVWHVNEWYGDLGSELPKGDEYGDCISHALPKDSGGRIIVTSRRGGVVGEMIGRDNWLPIDALLDQKARDICLAMFSNAVYKDGKVDINGITPAKMEEEISKICVGLPLAARTLAEIIQNHIHQRQ